ncbi:Protein eva-1 C [Orchesella cincta]|uniref:Protein eva-1 C n=1 Tax=Orchesella cincta TaxID=48709 RepID=A0A1D2MZ49_ORCCI|nr:Protein eva-1 C [Orchesella cincta]
MQIRMALASFVKTQPSLHSILIRKLTLPFVILRASTTSVMYKAMADERKSNLYAQYNGSYNPTCSEFKSVIGCDSEVIQLKCNRSSRLAIYSANYGRTEYESVQCPQPKGVSEESCLSSFATENVMQMCHGKRRCALGVNPSTFGNPCKPESKMYLKVIHTCGT